MSERILIAGIGNIFFGDDAFGPRVVRELSARQWPDQVEIADFGIRGIDLAFALLDDYRAAIFIDATPRGGEPGTLYLIEVDDVTRAGHGVASVETHNIDPAQVLSTVKAYGGTPPPLWVVGCEPGSLEAESGDVLQLSAPVEAALAGAVNMVESLVSSILSPAASTKHSVSRRGQSS
ncbi:MAG: hydrogenase maturation protease [Nitrolancea sp.]